MEQAISEATEPVVLVEHFDEHYYRVVEDGSTYYLPSVTTKLGVIDKSGLARWRGDIGNREADFRMHDAANRGKRIHWAWEIALKGGAVIYDSWNAPIYTPEGIATLKTKHGAVAVLHSQDEMWDIVKLNRQFQALKPCVLAVEKKVYDIENRDAGTIDSVLQIEVGDYLISGARPINLDAGIYVNDLKTGSWVDENTWLQLAAYGFMYEQMTGQTIAGALITHTGANIKSGIPGLKTLVRSRETLLTKDYGDYRHAAALWERNHQGEQPETYEFPSLITLKS